MTTTTTTKAVRWTRMSPGHYFWRAKGSPRAWNIHHDDGKVWRVTVTVFYGGKHLTMDSGWFATLGQAKADAERQESALQAKQATRDDIAAIGTQETQEQLLSQFKVQ